VVQTAAAISIARCSSGDYIGRAVGESKRIATGVGHSHADRQRVTERNSIG
jgi:hypothetical protein